MYNKKDKPKMNNKETIEQVLTYPIREISDWKITKETCQHFGVRVALSEKDGRTIEAVYFPYYDQNNKLCGYKKKDLTLPKDHDFHFTHIGSVKATGQLFGQNVAPSGGKKSFTHEGEKDVLASWQMLSNKFTSANPAVVGIPGTKWAARQIAANKRFYEQFKENVIVFDNDSCTEEELRKGDKKGKEATQDVAMLMPNILVTSFSEKDAHDMLMEGKEEEFYWAVIKPKKYVPQSIVQGGVGLERLKKPLSEGVYSKTFPKTMEKLRGFREGEMTIILSPPGVGKCLGKGTLVRKFDGTLIKVEDIQIGDLLMGPDSTARTVLTTVRGEEDLYKIYQSNGEPYIVNKSHILSLKASKSDGRAVKGNVLNENVETYNYSSDNHKRIWKGYRTGFDLKVFSKPKIDPYLLGLWLADGSSDYSKIWVNDVDVELIDYINNNFSIGHITEGNGCKGYYIKDILKVLKEYSLICNKHIPNECFEWKLQDRLLLIAGILDGDGYNCNGGVEITQKNNRLFSGLKDLCETAGFRLTEIKSKIINFVEYKRGIVKGNFSELPMKLNRKIHKSNVDFTLSTLSFESLGIGEYYGFTLKEDNKLFLLKDGTVTHNTTICKAIGYDLNVAEQTLFHIFVEEDIEKTQQSYIALDNNVFLPQLRVNPNILSDEQWEKSYNKLIDNGRTLWMDHFGSINPDLLMSDIRWAASNGFKFIILDHISMIFSGLETLNERKEIDILLTELAAFTKGAHVHPIVVSHVKRTQKNPPKNKDGSIKYPYWDTQIPDAARGSGAFEQLAWNIIALEPEILENGERGRVRTRVWKNREWNTLGVGDILTMDKTTGRMINAADIMDF